MPRLLLVFLLLAAYSPAFAQPKTGQARLDSLLAELPRAKSDTNRVNLLNAITYEYYYSKSSEGINYASQALALARRLTWKKGMAKSYTSLGNQYLMKSDYPQALTTYLNGLKLAEEIKDKQRISSLTGNVGFIYMLLTNYSQALAYSKKALKSAEELGNKEKLASALGILGIVYGNQGDYAKALDYQLKSVKLFKDIGYQSLDENTFDKLGLAYLNTADYPQALIYLQKGLKLSKTNRDEAILTRVYSNLGKLYLKIATDSNATFLTTLLRSDKANTLQKANAYIDSAVVLAKEQGDLDYLYRAYQTRSQIQEALGEPQAALASFKDFIKTKELIINQQNTSNIAAAMLQYEFDKKETALRYGQQLSAVQLQKQKQQRTYLLSGVGLLLVLLGLLVFGYTQKQKANVVLHQQKEEINQKSNQLEQSLSGLKATQTQLIQKEKMASLGELTAGIAHEIQNPLNFVNNFSEVCAELVTELKSPLTPEGGMRDGEKIDMDVLDDLTQNLQKIAHHGGRASAIVRGMLEHARSSTGEKRPTDLNLLADEYLKIAYHGLRAKGKDFNAELITNFGSELGLVEVVPQEIGRVLLNLYNNAFYAIRQRALALGGAETYVPTVWVSTHRLVNAVEIRVNDNGTGIPDRVKAKIFQPFFTTKPAGEGTGLGLSLSYDIVTKGHGGSLTVENQAGEGTTFFISLPV